MVLQKDITFIYSDSAEKAIYGPLIEEAERRGYKVKLTDDPFAKCEIGFYCQHINFPQFSKFSLIMLHDIIQQYGNWPDIWMNEPWNKYDIGILPSDQWVHNWQEASHAYYARPRLGIYKIGWPKADAICKLEGKHYRKSFNEKYGLDDSKKTVLYAPAWENDNKQDDFVQAVITLGVNVIIKQWDADPVKFPDQVINVKRMKALHEQLDGVVILPPETNIFVAIAASDILVSEESSTMCEAAMMGVPAISVSDWLIPDVKPSRFPKCDYDFVYMTTKDKLHDKVQELLEHYDDYKKQTELFAANNFANIGKSSKMIMDILDDIMANTKVRYDKLQPKELKTLPLNKYVKHNLISLRRECALNYAVRYRIFGYFWNAIRCLKRLLHS